MSRAQSYRIRSAAMLSVVVATIVLAGGCSNLFGPDELRRTTYGVLPTSGNMLLGDSMDFVARNRDNVEIVSNWTIDGTSIAAIADDGSATITVTARTRITVRVLRTGVSHITAVAHSDATQSIDIPVRVVDSTFISAVQVYTLCVVFCPPAGAASRVGTTVTVCATLVDAQGNAYATKPTQWLVSDSSVLGLSSHPAEGICTGREVTMLKAGTADVIVRFLGREGRLRLTAST